MSNTGEDLVAGYVARAISWLNRSWPRRSAVDTNSGVAGDDVSLFPARTVEEDRKALADARAWQATRVDAGFGAIAWPERYGGQGLPADFESAYRRAEREFDVPAAHEALAISVGIEAPTILAVGSEQQKERILRPLVRGDLLCCQMFSEPDAGSDLGSISLRARRDGRRWILNGQKVWTTGAQWSDLGLLIARTDDDAPRRDALTAFVLPMASDGIDVRPLRQMTGASSFNEVYFSDVIVEDDDRLGQVGDGWDVAMTTLRFERGASAVGVRGGSATILARLIEAARRAGRSDDPRSRQQLARLHSEFAVRNLLNRRIGRLEIGRSNPGSAGSLSKLAYSSTLRLAADTAASLLGPKLTADTGEWGAYAWNDFILGVPGVRIGGGTDEIQRNTIAERLLGLPRETHGRAVDPRGRS